MGVMTTKFTATEELRRIGEALDESIIAASPEELREELTALGMDPDAVVTEMDAVTARAKIVAAKRGLERAKQAVVTFKAKPKDVSPADREIFRKKLADMRSGDGANVSEMMMAARKGKGVSENDEQGTIDDLAQLAALEAEDPQEDE
jgi:hypothetical protein